MIRTVTTIPCDTIDFTTCVTKFNTELASNLFSISGLPAIQLTVATIAWVGTTIGSLVYRSQKDGIIFRKRIMFFVIWGVVRWVFIVVYAVVRFFYWGQQEGSRDNLQLTLLLLRIVIAYFVTYDMEFESDNVNEIFFHLTWLKEYIFHNEADAETG